ncbi:MULTISPECIES: MarR family winged helix-turn-helix transcriptional regulator [Paenibacillus]|uniref:MarR family winged helix-turn-helix transcriptional regulator n=1 Tax=Paenibacillus TaxID=44249 RepID=UPI0011242ACF|nr:MULTISPECIES: MarR family transcriptional regulator [Paenibacillus]
MDFTEETKNELQAYVLELPLHTKVFFSLVEATARLVDVSEKYWQSKGQNGARIRLLVEIMKEGGTILPSMLAKKIGVTKSNITLLLTPLESEGLIRRASHPQDGRKTIISITTEGQSLLLQHLPENRQGITDKMSKLSEQELNQLFTLLKKLNHP